MSPRSYGRMKEEKNLSEPLTSLVKKKQQKQSKEGTKKMWTHELSSSVYEYVRGAYKGSGETLGNIAAQARIFESGLNAWIDELEFKEGIGR